MRVVIDTNVLVSGMMSRSGPPGTILSRWSTGEIELVLSEWLRDELLDVLEYPRVVRAKRRAAEEFDEFKRLLRAVPLTDGPPMGEVRDPDDRYVLGAAFGRADVIISGDKDLIVLGDFAGIPILTPRQFLDLLDELDASGP